MIRMAVARNATNAAMSATLPETAPRAVSAAVTASADASRLAIPAADLAIWLVTAHRARSATTVRRLSRRRIPPD